MFRLGDIFMMIAGTPFGISGSMYILEIIF